MEIYQTVFIGLWVVFATIIFQLMVMVGADKKRLEKGYKIGVIDPSLGQKSFLFRSYRTFWNSLENIVPILGVSIVAILAGYSAFKLSIVIWIYAISRIIHMILYYFIATEKNPSPRSLFWVLGLLATIYLVVDFGIFLIF
ncbi:MAG: hypothetical protein CMC84_07155 [Flavobacteriaceae bacterium]|nr:hypothetical protein [Flavobacteriaceae bacterium]|tara:strand:+ start:512 stop:934 length:423 start_codon:yes stop_codon:yes gene_type:complete